jgi:1-deoxy-D-xylulose-5-phosphate reductoisomerase
MRLPIQYALTWPERKAGPAKKLDFSQAFRLDFEPPDEARFPALQLGTEVARRGGTAGAVLNAANEAAVELFLNGRIRFTQIAAACRAVVDAHPYEPQPTLARLLALDKWAREEVIRWTGC